MSQFDEFNARVERVKAEVDHDVARDTARREHQRGGGELGFGWKVLEFFASLVGEMFARTFVWILCTVVIVGAVASSIGVSFSTALMIVGVAAVAALAFAMSG